MPICIRLCNPNFLTMKSERSDSGGSDVFQAIRLLVAPIERLDRLEQRTFLD